MDRVANSIERVRLDDADRLPSTALEQSNRAPRHQAGHRRNDVRGEENRLFLERLEPLDARKHLVAHVHIELPHRLVHGEERVDSMDLLGLCDAKTEGQSASIRARTSAAGRIHTSLTRSAR